VQPNLTLLLDAPIELAMQRARARNEAQGQGAGDRFEAEQNSFFERVRHGYRARAAANSARFRIIDASQPLAAVTESVRATIKAFITLQHS
jgi:dTMP kinase